jgi:GTP-binding protein EngB required for normal cell division
MGLCRRCVDHHYLGASGAALSLLGYMAAGNQHRDTVVTFLIVFLIQNTQNRDAKATHLKLDEIIRALHPADNHMINIEKLSDEEPERLATQFDKIRNECKARKITTKTR